jgi:hypothetical protein
MKRASALLTWWYLVVGGICTVVAISAPQAQVRESLYLFACIQLIPVLFYACRRNGVSPEVAGFMVAVGLLYAGAQLVSGDEPTYTNAIAVTLGLAGTGCIIFGLVAMLRRRGVTPTEGLLGDGLIVGLGAWVISWAALVQPIVDETGTTAWSTVLYGMYQPTASVVLFLVVVVLLDQRNRPASMWLLAAALTFNLLGDLLYALIDAGHMPASTERVALPMYIAAFFSAGAAFLHPSITQVTRPQLPSRRPVMGRLIVTTSSLVFPVIVLAGTSANDTTDKIVRSISAIVLAAVVTARVAQAVRANNVAQAELLHGAQTDPLTGLPNRSVLLQQINDLMRGS